MGIVQHRTLTRYRVSQFLVCSPNSWHPCCVTKESTSRLVHTDQQAVGFLGASGIARSHEKEKCYASRQQLRQGSGRFCDPGRPRLQSERRSPLKIPPRSLRHSCPGAPLRNRESALFLHFSQKEKRTGRLQDSPRGIGEMRRPDSQSPQYCLWHFPAHVCLESRALRIVLTHQ